MIAARTANKTFAQSAPRTKVLKKYTAKPIIVQLQTTLTRHKSGAQTDWVDIRSFLYTKNSPIRDDRIEKLKKIFSLFVSIVPYSGLPFEPFESIKNILYPLLTPKS